MDRRSDDAQRSSTHYAVDEIASSRPDGRSTVGVITSTPGSRNTVAGTVDLTIDLRHPDVDELSRMNEELVQFANSLNPSASVNQIWYSPPVNFDSDVVDAIRDSATQSGFESCRSSCPVPVMMLCTSTVLRRLECCSFRVKMGCRTAR